MATDKNKQKIKKLTIELLKRSHKEAIKNVEKALNSGAIDVSGWDEKDMPMLVPKAIAIAVLTYEAGQYSGRGSSAEKKVAKDAKNIGYFL